MLNEFVDSYLQRIKYGSGIVNISKACLFKLHRLHVTSIPFENLDIHYGQKIKMEIDHLYNKIIIAKRGGFCYELNYLFSELLNEIGFETKIINARIYKEDKELGPMFDHMAIMVTIQKDVFLIDVGFGDLFIEPKIITLGHLQKDHFYDFKIELLHSGCYCLYKSISKSELIPIYVFDLGSRKLEDFDYQCKLKQISSDSYFVKNKICTLPFSDLRKTIFNQKFVLKTPYKRTTIPITDESHFIEILKVEFGINLPK